MRLLHTSDWHLGRTLHGASLLGEQAELLDDFVRVAQDVRPHAVIIAGDLYDRAVPPPEAVELFDNVLTRLVGDQRIPTVCIAGNHDSPERVGFGADLLRAGGLHLVGPIPKTPAPVTLHDEHGPVHIATFPYAGPESVRAAANDDAIRGHDAALRWMVERARAAVPEHGRRVAVAHAFVAGGAVSDSERPLSVGGSGEVGADVFAGFHYTALGHLHQPQHVGSPRVRYSGSLYKYSFREAAHRKSVTFVEMDAQGDVVIEEMPLRCRRDLRILTGTLADLLHAPVSEGRDDYIQVQLLDRGPVFEAMAKLREVYPNVLHIERPHTGIRTDVVPLSGDHRRVEPLDVFARFWTSVGGGGELTEAQHELVRQAIVEAAAGHASARFAPAELEKGEP